MYKIGCSLTGLPLVSPGPWGVGDDPESIFVTREPYVTLFELTIGWMLARISRRKDLTDFSVEIVIQIVIIISDLSVEPEEEEFKSLLHKKLYERNLALHKDIHSKVTENYTKVPQKLSDLRQNLTATEATFQESLMALQRANHHCSETFWNMDDSINIANSIAFPNH